MIVKRLLCLSLLMYAMIILCPQLSHAQYAHWTPYWDEWLNMRDIAPKGYVCHKAAAPVVVDGKLDDEAWMYIPWTDYFADIEGDVKPMPYYRTQVKMTWDDTYFYFGADLEERHVWGKLTEHDSIIYQDNDFEIFIDPDSDNYDYYELEINALNTVWDLMLHTPYRDGGERDNNWSIPGLKTAVYVHGTLNDPSDNDRGWEIEIAIPWAVLAEYANKPSPPKDGDLWRVGFSRVEYRYRVVDGSYDRIPGDRGENWVWSPPGVINMHCPERWGCVRFSTAKPGTVRYTPDPTEPARTILHDVYYAQREFFRAKGRYAANIEELGAPVGTHESVIKPPEIKLTGNGYTASLTVRLPNGKRQTLRIRHNSKIFIE